MTKKKMPQTIEKCNAEMELISMSDEEAKTFLRLILHTEEAREFLRKRAEEVATEKDP